jgi:hypothetical protein
MHVVFSTIPVSLLALVKPLCPMAAAALPLSASCGAAGDGDT